MCPYSSQLSGCVGLATSSSSTGPEGTWREDWGKGCHSKTRMSNKNLMSSLGITSSYLYKVFTKLSHVNL